MWAAPADGCLLVSTYTIRMYIVHCTVLYDIFRNFECHNSPIKSEAKPKNSRVNSSCISAYSDNTQRLTSDTTFEYSVAAVKISFVIEGFVHAPVVAYDSVLYTNAFLLSFLGSIVCAIGLFGFGALHWLGGRVPFMTAAIVLRIVFNE